MATTWYNRGHFFAPHVTPVLLDMQFTVAPADSGGLGITGLKGPGIKNVFMHTSGTPGSNNGMLNPNPAAGYILVQLKDSYSRLFAAQAAFVSPNSGSNLLIASAGLSVGAVYVISILGTTSQAQWQALGVPPGAAATVGMAFVALATSATGTGAVQVPAVAGSGCDHVEVVGTPNVSIAPQLYQGSLGVSPWLLLRCMGKSVTMGAYTPSGTNSAPAFTGSALGTHTHTVTPTGTNDASSPPIFTGDVDTTSATSAGTPAGTVAAPTFTGNAASLTGTSADAIATPAVGTVIQVQLYLSQSSVTTTGE